MKAAYIITVFIGGFFAGMHIKTLETDWYIVLMSCFIAGAFATKVYLRG